MTFNGTLFLDIEIINRWLRHAKKFFLFNKKLACNVFKSQTVKRKIIPRKLTLIKANGEEKRVNFILSNLHFPSDEHQKIKMRTIEMKNLNKKKVFGSLVISTVKLTFKLFG